MGNADLVAKPPTPFVELPSVGTTDLPSVASSSIALRRVDGMAYVENAGRRYVMICPTRKRPERVVNHPQFAYMNLVVHKSEMDDYLETFANLGVAPGAIFAHDVLHLARVNNWHLDNLWPRAEGIAEWLMMSDDDTRGLCWRMTYTAPSVNVRGTAQEIADIDCKTARIAQEAGAGMFGYPMTTRVQERKISQPFSLRRVLPSSHIGVFNMAVRWDARLVDYDDYDYSMSMMVANRITICNNMYSLWSEEYMGRAGANVGGMAGTRNARTMAESARVMVEKWGESIIRRRSTRRGAGYQLDFSIPQVHKMKMTRK